jgi:hypothetical protein
MIGRNGLAEDLAGAVMLLASGVCGYLTGQVIFIVDALSVHLSRFLARRNCRIIDTL